MTKTSQRGFTFAELLTAAAVIAIILSVSVPLYRGYVVETQTVDALSALKALELEVRAPAKSSDGLQVCDQSLVRAENLQNQYLRLGITAAPNDLNNPVSGKGFAAAMDVVSTVDIEGSTGVRVAKAFYEEVKNSRPTALVDGVISDTAVAFAIILSPVGQPFCESPGLSMPAASGPSGPTNLASNRPPIAGKYIDLGSTPEDTELLIDASKLVGSSYDPDGDTLSVSSVSATNGSVKGDASKGFSYSPTKDFYGQPVNLTFVVTDGSKTASGTAFLAVTPVTDPPLINISMTAAQEIIQTGTSGRAIIPTLDTGGDLREVSLEFSIVGTAAGSATGSTGPVVFNYGNNTDNNIISAWRPNNLNIAFLNTGYDTGLDLTDGKNHRVTVTWQSSTGIMKVFDNGVLARTITGVAKGQTIPGNGHAVIGQKMNNPGTMNGWNANEHYSGQIFGASLANKARSDSDVATAPLYTASRADGLFMDVRTEGGRLIDGTGATTRSEGDFTSSTVQVDTSMALVPPGSIVSLNIDVKPQDSDGSITSIQLSGFPSGTSIEDGSGKKSVANANITNWNLGSISAKLPSGYKGNPAITVTATATTPDAGDVTEKATQVLRMVP